MITVNCGDEMGILVLEEKLNNPEFKSVEIDGLRKEARSEACLRQKPKLKPTPKRFAALT